MFTSGLLGMATCTEIAYNMFPEKVGVHCTLLFCIPLRWYEEEGFGRMAMVIGEVSGVSTPSHTISLSHSIVPMLW